MRKMTLLTVATAITLLSAPAGASAPALVTGSGQTIVDGELRTFTFSARQELGDSANGTAEIHNRAVGEMFQIDVDCLEIAGDVAIMSGVVARHSAQHAVGLTGIFGVLDAGEGADSADGVSQVYFFRPNTLTCHDIDPAASRHLATPIAGGNVQIH